MSSSAKIKVTKTLRIDTAEISDQFIIQSFKNAQDDGQDLENYLESVLSIGCKALAAVGSSLGVERLAEGIDNTSHALTVAAEKFSKDISQQLSELSGDDGAFAKAVKLKVVEFTSQLESLTAGEDSPIRKGIKAQVEEMSSQILSNLVSQSRLQKEDFAKMLDFKDPTSPLRTFADQLEALGKDVKGIHAEIAREEHIAEIVDSTPIGGNDYEAVAVRALQLISGRLQDNCVPTGRSVGDVPRSFKGDAVTELMVGSEAYARIVMEAKNSAISLLDWKREAEGSRRNRSAAGFIGMCKNLSDMPNGQRILVLDNLGIVVACDPEIDDGELFALVYQVVKMNTLNEAGSTEGLSLPDLNIGLKATIDALSQFTELTKQASAIETSAGKIKEISKKIISDVTDKITAMQSAIRRSIEPEQSSDIKAIEEVGKD